MSERIHVSCIHEDVERYAVLERIVSERIADHKGPLFTTNVEGLFDVYLDRLPTNRRQHYHCLLPNSYVQGRFLGASKAFYSGKAVEIITRKGSRISLTVNHPILTDSGFVKANDVLPGKNLLHYFGEGHFVPSGVNKKDFPFAIQNVFDSFCEKQSVQFFTGKATGFDFDGDGSSIKGNIHVVRSNGSLLSSGYANRSQGAGKGRFSGPRVPQPVLSGSRTFHQRFDAWGNPSRSSIGGLCQLFSLGKGHVGHSYFQGIREGSDGNPQISQSVDYGTGADSIFFGNKDGRNPGQIQFGNFGDEFGIEEFCENGFGYAAELDVVRKKPTANGSFADQKLIRQLTARFPGKVAFDEVVHVRRFHYDGPVYDMETNVGYFVASSNSITDGIVISNCHACRRFVERYGGLVWMAAVGVQRSLLWNSGLVNHVPEFFIRSVAKMQLLTETARVNGVFLSKEATWGTPLTGEWSHLSGNPATTFTHPLLSASQAMAEKREDHATLRRALAEFSRDAVVQAVRVLDADAVVRSEKALGVVKWLLDLHERMATSHHKDNLAWMAVATAPPGWCHVRSTMIGTLLEDVVAGLPFDAIKARWDAKVHPLKYQRPTTISEGQIQAANAVVEKLGSEGALARRFARLGDVISLWRPRHSWIAADGKESGQKPFDHLLPQAGKVKEVELPAKAIGWEDFRAKVLPDAVEIELTVPQGNCPFYGLVTAENAEAPPILQWDGLPETPRCPVSWYFYHGGSAAVSWGLTPFSKVKVTAVCRKPTHWHHPDKFDHQGQGTFFVLEGARDVNHQRGAGFFPETLRSEYHAVRHAMEAHARQATIYGKESGDANGIALLPGVWGGQALSLHVRTAKGTGRYSLSW